MAWHTMRKNTWRCHGIFTNLPVIPVCQEMYFHGLNISWERTPDNVTVFSRIYLWYRCVRKCIFMAWTYHEKEHLTMSRYFHEFTCNTGVSGNVFSWPDIPWERTPDDITVFSRIYLWYRCVRKCIFMAWTYHEKEHLTMSRYFHEFICDTGVSGNVNISRTVRAGANHIYGKCSKIQLAQRFLRKRNLKILNLNDLRRRSMNDLDLWYS